MSLSYTAFMPNDREKDLACVPIGLQGALADAEPRHGFIVEPFVRFK